MFPEQKICRKKWHVSTIKICIYLCTRINRTWSLWISIIISGKHVKNCLKSFKNNKKIIIVSLEYPKLLYEKKNYPISRVGAKGMKL